MKILPLLLINLVVVGGGLVIYDQTRGETPHTIYQGEGADPVALADLESRLGRLEAAGHQPALRSSGDENLVRRVEALEQLLASEPRRAAPTQADEASEDPVARASDGSPITVVGEEIPSTGAVSRFRKLMDAANEQRRDEREREQLTSLLKRLDITMNEKQTTQYLSARRSRQDQMRSVFTGLRRGPEVDREAMMQQINEGRAKINEEFSVSINKFLPAGDAAKLAENEGQSRWGGAMRSGGRR